VQLNAPLERHEIYVDHVPHLYTLALVNKQFPRYAPSSRTRIPLGCSSSV